MHQIQQQPIQRELADEGISEGDFDPFLPDDHCGQFPTQKETGLFCDISDGDQSEAISLNNNISEKYGHSVQDPEAVPPIPCKRVSCGEARTSVFDDSYCKEVLGYLKSQTLESATHHLQVPNGNDDAETDDANFTKRSSASSVSTTSSSTSGVESGEEKTTASKNSSMDIAKILRTRSRIQHMLQVTPNGSGAEENGANPNQTSGGKKKPFYISKRYATLGRNKSSSALRNSRPPSSGGDEAFPFSSIDIDLDHPDRRVAPNSTSRPLSLTQFTSGELGFRKSLDLDELCGATVKDDSKRWSRISSTSNNGDKGLQSPQKGPWKAFKKFVNNTNNNNNRSSAHLELKSSIHLQRNSNFNNNVSTNSTLESSNLCDVHTSTSHITSSSSRTADGSPDTRCRTANPPLRDPPPKKHTNSLMRRFSRRGSSKTRNERRKSLPVESVLGVNVPKEPSSSQDIPSSKTSEVSEVETMVMSHVQSRHHQEEEKTKSEKPKKTSSIRKRLFSFSRKRSASQERKSILKPKDSSVKENDDNGQMSKALSYSSPQLSIFAVKNRNHPNAVSKLHF